MKTNSEKIILGSIAAAFLILFGLLVYFTPHAVPMPQAASLAVPADASILVRNTSHMTASSTAKVTLVEFGDYECPYCGQESPVLRQLVAQYAGNPDFNFVFRNFPLPQHQNAMIAAEAAEAAGAQGKFWEMNGMLYEKQAEWSESASPEAIFSKYAASLGFNVQKFDSDLASQAYLGVIQADEADGMSLHVNHTPTLFLNGVEQSDYSFSALKSAVDSALSK